MKHVNASIPAKPTRIIPEVVWLVWTHKAGKLDALVLGREGTQWCPARFKPRPPS